MRMGRMNVALFGMMALAVVVMPMLAAGDQIEFELCSEEEVYPFDVEEIELEPLSPNPGETVTITFKGEYAGPNNVTAGELLYEVGLGPIGSLDGGFDLCERTVCPVGPGTVVVDADQDIPTITPPGEYQLTLRAVDGSAGREGLELMCVQFVFRVAGDAGDFIANIAKALG